MFHILLITIIIRRIIIINKKLLFCPRSFFLTWPAVQKKDEFSAAIFVAAKFINNNYSLRCNIVDNDDNDNPD